MAKRVITKRLGEVLLERGIITRKQLEQALADQQAHGGLIGAVLIRLKLVTEEEVALALTAQYGFPYLPLSNYDLDHTLMTLIPEETARRYCLIAIDRIGNALTLAMADPSNTQAIEDIEMTTKCVVQTFVSTPSDITLAIDRFYKKASGPNGTPPAAGP